ncbi:MAG: non-hydrolyzing UDP-N-acetylglucosamine 2-epimerase [Halolamina sp.]
MNVCSVVGVRPEFVMAAPVDHELGVAGHTHSLVHTGQHHDDALSAAFFEALSLPAPTYQLDVGSAPRGEQVGRAVERLVPVLAAETPTAVLVYGDTTSTLAGALAAVATATPLVHVEAGLRSDDWRMPEERTRVLVDHLADLRLAPTQDAVAALEAEGITTGVRHVGDVRADAVASTERGDVDGVGSLPNEYVLATVHRAATTDDEATLRDVLAGLAGATAPVVLPIHPRTADRLRGYGETDWAAEQVRLIDPVPYATFLGLLAGAAAVATDSGGVQREASYLGTPCVTLRDRTEWRGTVRQGRNVLAGTDPDAVAVAVDNAVAAGPNEPALPTGAAAAVVAALEQWHRAESATEGDRCAS